MFPSFYVSQGVSFKVILDFILKVYISEPAASDYSII